MDTSEESSIDTVNLESETLYFQHSYFNLRKCEVIPEGNVDIPQGDFIFTTEILKPHVISPEEIEDLKAEQILRILQPKVEKYMSGDQAFKCTFMENLSSYAEQIGYENTCGFLIPLVKSLGYESIEVVEAFIKGSDKFLDFLKNNNGYINIINDISPLLQTLIANINNARVVKASTDIYINIFKVAKEEDRFEKFLPALIEMIQNDKKINLQLQCMIIFNRIADLVGPELCECYFVPQIVQFSEESKEEKKLCCIMNIDKITTTVTEECLTDKIYPILAKFAKDSSISVKKALTLNIPKWAEKFTKEINAKLLLEIYFTLTKDADASIKNTCLQIFGRFIYYLPIEVIREKEELLTFYTTQIVEIYKKKAFGFDTTPIYESVFTFPCVLSLYTADKWPELKKVFELFYNDKESRIKLTLARSFAEISKLLGPELSEADLTNKILNQYKSNGFEIKKSILKTLPSYLETIKNEEIKTKFLVCFKENFKERKKWRDKINFTKQLRGLTASFSVDVLFSEILPMVLTPCFDGVSQVRIKCCKYLSFVLCFILEKENKEINDKCLGILKCFAYHKNYNFRQLYLRTIWKIINKKEVFQKFPELTEYITNLAFDKVESVRISLSMFFNKKFEKKVEWLKDDKKILGIIKLLKIDSSPIVKEIVENINVGGCDSIDPEGYKNINEKYTGELEYINELGLLSKDTGDKKWFKK
ncbi:MAG: hypothetical protein MJ252_24290 [archaeon]|nr:hypothetical protein [archaeon]